MSVKMMREGVYRIDVRDEHGRRVRWSIEGTRRQARDAEQDWLAERDERKAQLSVPGAVLTVGAAVDFWLERSGRDKTPDQRRRSRAIAARLLDPEGGIAHRLLGDLTRDHVREWGDGLVNQRTGGGLSGRAKNDLLIRLASALTCVIDAGQWKGPHPLRGRGLKWPEQRGAVHTLTTEQVQRLWRSVEAGVRIGGRDFSDVVLLALAYLGIARKGEVAGLRWEDWDRANGLLTIRRSYDATTTKGGRNRTVPVHPLLAQVLAEQRGRVGRSPWVVPDSDGNMRRGTSWNPDRWLHWQLKRAKLCSEWVHRHVGGGGHRACSYETVRLTADPVDCPECSSRLWAVGVPLRVRFHALRHCAVSHLLEQGGSLADVKELVGHAQISTTVDVYGHLTAGHLRGRIDGLLPGTPAQTKQPEPAAVVPLKKGVA